MCRTSVVLGRYVLISSSTGDSIGLIPHSGPNGQCQRHGCERECPLYTSVLLASTGLSVVFFCLQLTLQVRTIALATRAVAKGDLTQKVTGVAVSGEILDLVNTINSMIDQLAIFAAEVKKVAREVGTEGTLGGQAEVGNVEGIWQEITYVSCP